MIMSFKKIVLDVSFLPFTIVCNSNGTFDVYIVYVFFLNLSISVFKYSNLICFLHTNLYLIVSISFIFKQKYNNIILKMSEQGIDTSVIIDENTVLESAKVTKLNKIINSASWNEHLEDIMKAWGEKAAGNREMHDKAAEQFRTFSNKMYVPILCMSTLTGVSNFGAANSQYSEYFMYGIGSLNIVCAVLTGLLKFLKPDDKAQMHTSVARNFGSFYRQITLELGMTREDRTNADELTKWAKTEYDRMQNEAPSIPSNIIKLFKSEHQNQKNLPDIAANTYNISIYGRDDDGIQQTEDS